MDHPRQNEIRRMADVFEPDEIAASLGLTDAEVRAALPKRAGFAEAAIQAAIKERETAQ